MPAAPHIARATLDDVADLAPLLDAYRRFYRQPSDVPASRAFLFDRLSNAESVIFVARMPQDNGPPPGRAVGFVQLYPTFTSVGLGRRWILNDLYVDESARRLGVGRALMERAMQHARETNVAGMMLLTETTNNAAQTLYESLGWTRDTVYHRYTWKG